MTLELTREPLQVSENGVLGDYLKFSNGRTSPGDSPSGTKNIWGSNGVIGRTEESNSPENTIVIGRVGAYCGSVAFAKEESWVTDNAIKGSLHDTDDDPRFWYYKLSSMDLGHFSHGTSHPLINQSILNNLEVRVPPREERIRIAEILGSVDDKIEANSRLLDSLYKLLHELYILRTSQSSQEISLTGIADFVNGKAFTKNATGTGRMVVRIAELNGGPGASTVYNEIPDVEEKHLVNPGEILMSWSGTLGVFLWSREQAIVNQHIFKVIPKSGYSMGVVYCAIQSVTEKFQAIAQDQATTMGHIKRRDLETPVLVPSNTEELENLFSLISTLEQENNTLAETRDRLIRYLIG